MFASSSNLALISIKAVTVFPFSAAVIKALTIGESNVVLYRVCLIAITFLSYAAWFKNSITASNVSKGWWTIKSFFFIVSKKLLLNSFNLSTSLGLKFLNLNLEFLILQTWSISWIPTIPSVS